MEEPAGPYQDVGEVTVLRQEIQTGQRLLGDVTDPVDHVLSERPTQTVPVNSRTLSGGPKGWKRPSGLGPLISPLRPYPVRLLDPGPLTLNLCWLSRERRKSSWSRTSRFSSGVCSRTCLTELRPLICPSLSHTPGGFLCVVLGPGD